MQRLTQTLVTALLTLALNTLVVGGEPKSVAKVEHTGSKSPHVHGSAELHIVLDTGQLIIELHSPAMNLLGFEHNASSPEQQAVVESTRNNLTKANEFFLFDGGECSLNQQSANFSAILKTSENLYIDDDQHNTEPNSQEHHHEDHESNHDSHSNNTHNNIEAIYQYNCEKPDKLISMTTHIQDVFPSIRALQVQWIVHNQQGAAKLSPKHNKIHFR